MTTRMLIDATHPEEIRVAVVDGHRLEEFDFEIAAKKALKGNIYLAKVTRVEPSLQAAFVDYGGNRHGFLAFSEIHPDYYRIPVADREALLAEQAALDHEEDEESDRRHRRGRRSDRSAGRQAGRASNEAVALAQAEAEAEDASALEAGADDGPSPADDEALHDHPDNGGFAPEAGESGAEGAADTDLPEGDVEPEPQRERERERESVPFAAAGGWEIASDPLAVATPVGDFAAEESTQAESHPAADDTIEPVRGEVAEVPAVVEVAEVVGEAAAPVDIASDELEEGRRRRARQIRRYKIQEVVKRRQIMLVQVTKEERGNKGAALTTYLSLAGRYCVLMPNTPRGGGISRKITNPNDRKRLKSIIDELDIPEGIAVIVRTAGSERSKAEIKRDYEYLLRLWDEIRELTLRSTAPALVYEEANLIKRAIRDLYSKNLEDVLVEGEEGYKLAKSFMRMLTPSHAKRVQLYKDATVPLFHRYQVESQIDAIHQPVVQLRSGGYIVLNQTEALVAIDVNSGRATRERHIEETAVKTNLEASDEIARQLRLRDLAGLIVIDFIDMEDQRHNNQVERRLKEALKNDRARIQLGRISHFGLLEMSRQRLRPSLIETSTVVCRHCAGTGHVRTTESTALHLLRAFEEEGIRKRSSEVTVSAPTAVALYILNQKRQALTAIEQRYGLTILLAADDSLIPPDFRMERTRLRAPDDDRPLPVSAEARHIDAPELEEEPEEEEAVEESEAEEPVEARAEGDEDASGERRRRRSRRRRRRGDKPEPRAEVQAASGMSLAGAESDAESESEEGEEHEGEAEDETAAETSAANGAGAGSDASRKRRRRGKRGGRRRRRDGASPAEAARNGADQDHLEDADAVGAEDAAEPMPEIAHPEVTPSAEPDETPSAPEIAERPWPQAGGPSNLPEETAPLGPEPELEPEVEREGGFGGGPASVRPQAEERERGAEGAMTSVERPAAIPQHPAAQAEPADAAPRPRRKGWWQRVLE